MKENFLGIEPRAGSYDESLYYTWARVDPKAGSSESRPPLGKGTKSPQSKDPDHFALHVESPHVNPHVTQSLQSVESLNVESPNGKPLKKLSQSPLPIWGNERRVL